MAEIIKLGADRSMDFDRETVEQAYDRWAPIYDLVFGGVFSKGLGLGGIQSSIWPMLIALPLVMGAAVALLRKQER